jgi:branched-chain amino acid transport system permease protein
MFATVVIGLVGLAIQQVLLRWNQGQDLRQALITIAVSVIFADQMLAHYGGIAQSVQQPSSWPNAITVGSFHYGWFRLVIVLGSAVVIGVLLYLLIKRTRFGMIVRAGVDDRAMLSALGVNVQLVFAGAFLIGSLLAGFAGVLGGTMISVVPGNDTLFLLDALIVVIIGGMGSFVGAAIGSVLLGLVQSYSSIYLKFGGTDLTNYAILTSFILVIAVLAVRPLGLFGRPA